MRRLNENHSIGGLLDKRAAAGEITVHEAAESADRSRLTEAVLGDDIRLVDAPTQPLRLQCGDLVVLASDGVETCSLEELRDISKNPQSAAVLVTAILQAVEAHGLPTQDNATVIVFRPDSKGSEF